MASRKLTVVDPQTGEVLDPADPLAAGMTIEGMEEQAEVFGRALDGTVEQLSFKTSSEFRLSDSTVKLTAIPTLAVRGQFKEGDKFKLVLECEVDHVSFPPIKHKGFRVGTERRHTVVVLAAEQLAE